MKWRAYLRLTAILVNGVFALWLIGVRGWWMSIGFLGLPMIAAPRGRGADRVAP